MRVGLIGAPGIIELHLLRNRDLEPLDGDKLARRAKQAPFRTRAIVTFDLHNEGVVEFADVLDHLDHPTDLVVGIGNVGGEYLGLAGE